jgi:NifU-like protein
MAASASAVRTPDQLSQRALARLREPLRRGSFRPLDAARAQQALCSVEDGAGQARCYWLVDLADDTVADARFLAYGDLASHPLADAFSERVRGLSFTEATTLDPASIEAELRDDPDTPAFTGVDDSPLELISRLQTAAIAERPKLVLLPKPVEVERYVRKREQDWTEEDKAWLPLSLLKKIGAAQKVIAAVVAERIDRTDLKWTLEGLHDDFRMVIRYEGANPEEIPLLNGFVSEALRQRLHPSLGVEEAS